MVKRKSYKKHLKKEIQFLKYKSKKKKYNFASSKKNCTRY